MADKPKAVTDFECVIIDYERTECTWDKQEQNSVIWSACVGLRYATRSQSFCLTKPC